MKISQRERIKNLFKSRLYKWIPLPEILSLYISQYGTRIKELRDIENMNIENKTEFVNGVKHSWFRYVPNKEMQETFGFNNKHHDV